MHCRPISNAHAPMYFYNTHVCNNRRLHLSLSQSCNMGTAAAAWPFSLIMAALRSDGRSSNNYSEHLLMSSCAALSSSSLRSDGGFPPPGTIGALQMGRRQAHYRIVGVLQCPYSPRPWCERHEWETLKNGCRASSSDNAALSVIILVGVAAFTSTGGSWRQMWTCFVKIRS